MAKIELDFDTALLISILYYNLTAEAAQNLKQRLDPEYQEAIERALKLSDRDD